jgi:hypothetical protein
MKCYRSLPTFIVAVAAIVTLAAASMRAAAPVIIPPSVPSDLEVLTGDTPFLIGHARGTQNYVCLPNGNTFSWTLFGPQATLFDDAGAQQITHFLSANPVENGTLRASWQHSGDTSAVWAAMVRSSTDPNFVAPDAIPWLLLAAKGAQYGSALGHKLTYTTYVQRVNTAGGLPPAGGCSGSSDVGRKVFIPYTADYVFYRP